MLLICIRYFFIVICSIYSYYKILNLEYTKIYCVTATLFSLIISTIIPLSIQNNYAIKILLIFVSYFIFISLQTQTQFRISLFDSIISFCISYLTLSISCFILSIIYVPFHSNLSLFPSTYFILITGAIQSILVYLLFKIKRLKNGMPFLLKSNLINIGFFLCIILIAYNIFIRKITPTLFPFNLIAMIIVIIFLTLIYIWWRRKLTQSYVEKLRVSEVETLYKEISDRDLEIEKLHAHNAQLGQIIHKDNKLIPAMELAVRSYLQTAALMEPEEAKHMGAELLAKLERMSADRAGIVRTYKENNTFRQRTGVSSIDAIVDFMENKASTLGIEYHYQFDKGIKEKLPAYINEDDTMHLLSEISDNAIIASTYSNEKFVHVHIGFIQDMLFIDISDSGIPFTPETYQNWGMLQHTTHGNHGGSGIGLMDLAQLKKQYKFSLQIYEYPPSESVYTKKIRILFDKKNHYLIQSYRAREIRSTVMRNDLHVLQYVDTEKITTLLEEKSKRAT